MATRIGYIGTEAVGDVLTAANFNKLPNGCVAYAVDTTNRGPFTTIADFGSLTTGSYTYPGSRLYEIRVHIPLLVMASTVGIVKVYIRDSASATQGLVFSGFIGKGCTAGEFTAGDVRCSVDGSMLIAPAAAAETYKVSISCAAGNAGGAPTVSATLNSQPGDPGRAWIGVFETGISF